ncbi:MAG: hypothetical protein EZS28_015037 [Streblomastix strix]|uniref:Uncharacterized protein n=1 Tax=Streblomastix strix TaxID=222440 RepID=A0A5J4W358_9EUKA|nr:MAG: hypothetical protein EZS28_015037 [Streblomastix strix]
MNKPSSRPFKNKQNLSPLNAPSTHWYASNPLADIRTTIFKFFPFPAGTVTVGLHPRGVQAQSFVKCKLNPFSSKNSKSSSKS